MWLTENNSSGEYFIYNWTKPIFNQILSSLNNSANRPYEIFNNHIDYSDNKGSYVIPPQLGLISSIILIMIFDKIFLKREYYNDKHTYILHWPPFINLNMFINIFSLIFFIFIFPIISAILLFFYLHKQFIKIMLKIKYGTNIIMMMDGMDTVWALEEDNARSIINVVCIVEDSGNNNIIDELYNEDLLNRMRKKMSSQLTDKNTVYHKLLYRKSFEYGYHFWKRTNNLNLNEIIKPIHISDDEIINEDCIQRFVSEQSNTKLPLENTFPWEILVGGKPIYGTKLFPILFRIHHSLGDGVALLNLLLNTVGTEIKKNAVHRQYESFKESVIYFFDIYDWHKICNNIYKHISMMKKYFKIICLMPACLINQILRPPDDNALHGPILNGNKIISWVSDDHDVESLLYKMKRIKRNIPGATFSELFLTALSISLHKYLNQKKSNNLVPDFLTAVVPVRMELPNLKSSSLNVQLENKFSVAMLTIPLDIKSSSNSILNQLISVRRETNEIRNKSDFYVNYWLMKVGGSILPEFILKPMLTSVQATLVVSNLPGPSNITICDHYKLEKISFFVPHRGTTGIGVTIISYNDRIHLGMMADSRLMSDRQDATAILKNIIEQLEKLDNLTSNTL